MQADFSVGEVQGNKIIVGFQNPVNGNKREWLEQRDGQVFSATTKEIETLYEVAEDFIRNIT